MDKRFLKGKDHPNWRGGRTINTNGYILIKNYSHPHRQKNNWIPEHRLIMEKAIGRYLKRGEEIHHINGIPSDNRPKNLLLVNRQSHIRIEFGWLKGKNGWWYKECRNCGKYRSLSKYRGMFRKSSGIYEYCIVCKICSPRGYYHEADYQKYFGKKRIFDRVKHAEIKMS